MDEGIDEWVPVLPAGDLLDGKPARATIADADLLLCRSGDRVFAVSNRCTHQGALLHKGIVKVTGSMPMVICPFHGSMFLLTDGRVMRGPAATSLPTYEARVSAKTVEVRLKAQ